MQYVPEEGVYVYFRYDAGQTVMCIMNQHDKEMEIDASRFEERIKGFSKAKNVVDGAVINTAGKIKIPAKTVMVMELM